LKEKCQRATGEVKLMISVVMLQLATDEFVMGTDSSDWITAH